METEEILKVINQLDMLHQNMIQKILKFTNKRIEMPHLKSFAYFLGTLTNGLVNKGHGEFVLGMNKILIEILSPRFTPYKISLKEVREQKEEYLTYYTNLDNAFKELSKDNTSEFSNHILKIEALLEETPPVVNRKEEIETQKDHYYKNQYFNDYLSTITHFYESFLVIGLYLLILLKLYSEEDIQKDLNDFKKNTKRSVRTLYRDNISKKHKKLLRNYLSLYPLPKNHKKNVLELFDDIFDDEGIRGLRIQKVHHNGEKEYLEYLENQCLKITYRTGKIEKFSLDDIHKKKINITLIVHLGFLIINNFFYNLLYQILDLEVIKERNPNSEKNETFENNMGDK